ncbi:MAG: type III secretion system outer membrane ring subunit SctC, partial [Candidatus Accumulibacter sp.]|nr:type III secretion system outer membrane ring subunit SctC [Accumulibacter sp.]
MDTMDGAGQHGDSGREARDRGAFRDVFRRVFRCVSRCVFRRAAALPLALACGCALAAAPGGIFRAPYSHYSQQEPLPQVLSDFARAQGFRAEISGALNGALSGRFDKIAPATFLRAQENAFGARWYVLRDTIYFYHSSETRQAMIPAPAMGVEALRARLAAAGLVAAQLPLEAGGEGDVLLVSGPPSYVRAIEAMAELLENAGTQNAMRVFRLKYASADDVTMESAGRSVTVPGVASLLRAMASGAPEGAPGATVVPDKTRVDKLKGSGLAAEAKAKPAAAEDGRRTGLSIVADPRINAVIVQDTLSRLPYYEQVIADLDKPAHLIEIHAAIVDVDSDFKRDLGLEWQGQQVNGNFSASSDVSMPNAISGAVPVAAGQFAGSGAVLSTIYTHGANFFMARIQALEDKGQARMLGRPSVLTTDNLEATLENITTYYISVPGNEEVDLFKVEAGTVLRVTPHIIENPDGQASIRLSVMVQDDQKNDTGTMTGSMAIPPIKQTKINTQAIIDAGQSLLIGGYYFEQKS